MEVVRYLVLGRWCPIRVHITAPENGDLVWPPYESWEKRDPYIVRFQWWKKVTMLLLLVLAIRAATSGRWVIAASVLVIPVMAHVVMVRTLKIWRRWKGPPRMNGEEKS